MENSQEQIRQPFQVGPEAVLKQRPLFPTGKKELIFGTATLVSGLALCNFVLFGGFHLGFALAAVACILSAGLYLLAAGCKPTVYSGTLLIISIGIALGFARTDDGFVKFVMVLFLLVGVNLGLCLTAGQNLRNPGTVGSLLDAPRTAFRFGFGRSPRAFRGLAQAFRKSGSVGQKGGALLLGLCLCVPVLAVVIPLLISADAAFDGLIALLPRFDLGEFFATVLFGAALWCVLYVRGVALRHSPKEEPKKRAAKGMSAITVNTVLGAVCLVYVAYLISQLAYFVGGFAGILPQEYTMAEYARRGFFEMAWLCVVNLGLIVLSLGLVRKEKTAPVSTRLLCMFIGLVTLFLVAAASAKMFLYIDAYGLTRLRVLTQIIMLFFGLTTLVVMLWLFLPKLPYMKAVVLLALLIGGATFWMDVDTQVARYNVEAYLSGALQTVDVEHLYELGDGAVAYLVRLAEEAPDSHVALEAQKWAQRRKCQPCKDFRQWNYAKYSAEQYLPFEVSTENTLERQEKGGLL